MLALAMEVQGYPSIFLLVILGIGIPLALARPYAAFLCAVTLVMAGHITRMAFTRTVGLGPFFNAIDSCMVVALVACLMDATTVRRPLRVPRIVAMMVVVVGIGAVQSLWKFGWTQETMRACRYAMQMPLAFFLGANLVISETRARMLIRALLVASVLAAVQHVFFVGNIWRTQALSMNTYHLMRTIGFWAACMPATFLIAGMLWRRPSRILYKVMYLLLALLFLATVFLNQTRSLWIAMVVGLFCSAILFGDGGHVGRIVGIAVVLLLLSVALSRLCQAVLPGLDPSSLIADRTDSLLQGHDMGTRERGFKVEMTEWFDGTLVLGRGLAFFQTIWNPKGGPGRIAFAHLGYVTYLSQLGLIGFLVYGLCLPFRVLREARLVWMFGETPDLRYLGLLGGVSIVCLSIMFVASSHFLAIGYEGAGVLYGALWAVSRTLPLAETERADVSDINS